MSAWRQTRITKGDLNPIFNAVKSTQEVFNGYGAQETCDMLVEALIYPSMPTWAVCRDDEVWARFYAAVFSYQKERVRIATAVPSELPYVSGQRPFRFDKDGHGRFLVHVAAYRRTHVKVNQDTLSKMQELCLLDASAVIQNNGRAVGEFNNFIFKLSRLRSHFKVSNDSATLALTSRSSINVRAGCKRVKLPNFLVALPSGSKTLNMYTPFMAKPHPSWKTTVSSHLNKPNSCTSLINFA